MAAQRLKIIEGGKLVIPASMRRKLGLSTGDTVIVDLDGDTLRVRSLDSAVARAQAIVRRHVPAGVSLVDELIETRRREAARE